MKPLAAGNNKVYESTDMWSIGLIILYSMFNGTHPFILNNNDNKW